MVQNYMLPTESNEFENTPLIDIPRNHEVKFLLATTGNNAVIIDDRAIALKHELDRQTGKSQLVIYLGEDETDGVFVKPGLEPYKQFGLPHAPRMRRVVMHMPEIILPEKPYIVGYYGMDFQFLCSSLQDSSPSQGRRTNTVSASIIIKSMHEHSYKTASINNMKDFIAKRSAKRKPLGPIH